MPALPGWQLRVAAPVHRRGRREANRLRGQRLALAEPEDPATCFNEVVDQSGDVVAGARRRVGELAMLYGRDDQGGVLVGLQQRGSPVVGSHVLHHR
jgi:hypothetical protein